MAKKVLEEVRQDCFCEGVKYCPLEALLNSMNGRILEQHKLAEFYRFKLGQKGKPNLTWDETYQLWVSEGLAKKFAKVYSPDKTYKQMRQELFNE
jgi:hypothetical protein